MAETSTAVIASANNLSVKCGAQVVLNGATIAFTEGEHIGLVGRNGSGKSTFLQIAAGAGPGGSGEFTRPPGVLPRSMSPTFCLDGATTGPREQLHGAARGLCSLSA